MSHRSRISLKLIVPLGLLAVAALALVRRPAGDEWEYQQEEPPSPEPRVVAQCPRRRPAARFAFVASFVTLFFAGAAFTAGAGDGVAKLLDEESAAVAAAVETAAAPAPAADEADAADPATAAEPALEPAEPEVAEPAFATPAAALDVAPPAPLPALSPPAETPAAETTPVVVAEAPAARVVARGKPSVRPPARSGPVLSRSRSTKKWVLQRALRATAPKHEIHGEGEPTVWLNRALPDPTPPSARLDRSFATTLVSVAREHGADWAALLGVLRAQGERGSTPATAAEVAALAAVLSDVETWRGALALSGRTAFADRAEALADLYRSVGIEALVTGYEASKSRLGKRLLQDDKVVIYGAGRDDIAAARIDVRILVLLGYLAERHGSLTISSLFSGHRRFARPGVVSAHVYGQAVDVAAVGGKPVAGHQQAGGATEDAVRSVLLLPAELQPRQVISLLGLGGPSFALGDHGDHIHVGF